MVPSARRSGTLVARCLVAACLLAGPQPLAAQTQSAVIRGAVTDASGGVASGAQVTLVDALGYELASAVTDAAGAFAIEAVPLGTYTVRVETVSRLSGARSVAVQSALPVVVAIELTPQAAEHVVVHGAAEQPSITSRLTISGEALRSAPARLSSRSLQQMLATLPGFASEDNGLVHVRGVDDGFLYVEDGVPVYDRVDQLFGIAPDPAGIGSLHVMTGYVPAEYGLKSGAVIEIRSAALPRQRWTGELEAGTGSDALAAGRAFASGPLGRADLAVNAAGERSQRFLDPVHPDNFHNQGGSTSGGARAAIALGTQDRLTLAANYGGGGFDVSHGEVQEEAGQDQRESLRQGAATASWQRSWSQDVVSQAAGYYRRIAADLDDTAAAIPLFAASRRRHERGGVLGSVTLQVDRHTVKTGLEVAQLALREDFTFAVTDEEEAEAAGISDGAIAYTLADPFAFSDRVSRTQWSAYVQDSVRLTDHATLDLGLRFDRTQLLLAATQWSPRLGLAYAWPSTLTTLRASVNRFYQPPQPEHLLLSSSPEARALSPFVDDDDLDGGGAALEPERQVAWEGGVEHWLGGRIRADLAVWSRSVRNYADPNVFFGTTIVFPNSVARGWARGLDLRLELPRAGGWSSYLTYTLAKVEQEGPINGGLFLEDDIAEIGPGTRFTPDHDQRHVASAGLTYQPPARGLVAALTARYESGTPVELDDDELDDLDERPGGDRVDVERGRVTPRFVVDAAVSQRLLRGTRSDFTVRVSALNLFDDAYALNFGNPFSGTHFGAPRTFRIDLQFGLR